MTGMKSALIAVPLLVLLASCGSSDEPTTTGATGAPSATTSSPASVATAVAPSPPDAESVASNLKKAIDSITKTVTITEDNDPNNAIGRPGKYEQAVSIYDSRVKCAEPLDITCGAKVEVFPDEAAAQARADYIADLAVNNPILGAEYHYVSGPILLRVTGDLKPSQAKEYEAAFAAQG